MERDHRLCGRVLADERLVAPELIVAVVHRLPLQRGRHREESHARGLRRGILLDGLEMVEHPDRSAVRRDEHRVVARVNGDLVHTHGGEVRAQPAPARTAVEREEDPRLGARIEHVGVARVFRERVHDLTSEAAVNTAEGRAEVGGHPHIRAVVVLAVIIHRHVGGAGVEARGDHFGDVRSTREPSEAVRHVGPGGAPITRHLYHAIVRASPDHAGLLRRLGERDDRRPDLNAVVACDGDRGVLHAEQRRVVAIAVAREVGRDHGP